jgi:D-alanyl-lipoteichoic acid acyltransferase DltB (MBOAT superfamily)
MLTASLLFYSYNRWWTLGVIAGYCLVDWGTGLMLGWERRRLVLLAGVAFNIGVLAFWKYTPLLVSTMAAVTGTPISPAWLAGDWTVPLGISFFALSGIAYMVDVYAGAAKPEPSLWRYSLFIAFFPHLVAGPILRAREFLVDLRPGELPMRPLAPWEASFLMARGYFKKMVLADTIAQVIDPFFANVSNPTTDGVWALPYIYLYSLQIYCDFSGYTDIARGLGLWFGFRWPENFNWPYLARSIREFWRRWHMTLSRFLRDYLYIPLGGSHFGPMRTALNLAITMLLGGIWHGAGWSFALWGLLHASYLFINHSWRALSWGRRLEARGDVFAQSYALFSMFLTFQAVCFAWCFFRLTEISDALVCVRKLIVFDADKALVGPIADPGLWSLLGAYGVAAAAAMIISGGAPLALIGRRIEKAPMLRGFCWGGVVGLGALALSLAPGGRSPPFIYFQF